jgi:hypothetical protein
MVTPKQIIANIAHKSWDFHPSPKTARTAKTIIKGACGNQNGRLGFHYRAMAGKRDARNIEDRSFILRVRHASIAWESRLKPSP